MGNSGGGGGGGSMPGGGFFPDEPQLGGLIGQPWNMSALFGGGDMVQAGGPAFGPGSGQSIFDIAGAAAPKPPATPGGGGIFGPDGKIDPAKARQAFMKGAANYAQAGPVEKRRLRGGGPR